MLKKLTLLVLSVVALLAFAAPAAQATGPLITNSLGGTAKTITAQSTNTKWEIPIGTFECRTVNLHGSLITNANTTVEAVLTGTAAGTVVAQTHTGHCGSSVGSIDIDAFTFKRFHLARHGSPVTTTGTIDLSFTTRITTIFGAQHCTYEAKGASVTRTGANSIKVSGKFVKIEPSPGAICPSEGAITGDFTVRDEFGSLAIIH